jgi:tetratricopeptide (TPR) repeat protein
MRGHFDSAAMLLDSGARMPRDKIVSGVQHDLASFDKTRGQLRSAEQRLAVANDQDVRTGYTPREGPAGAIPLVCDSIWTDLWIRERPATEAVRRLDALVARFPETGARGLQPSDLMNIAVYYAVAGRIDRARAMIARLDHDVPDSVAARGVLALRRWAEGEIALAERNYEAAVRDFRAADAPDGVPLPSTIFRDALLGRAFDLAGKRDSAIAALERYVSTPYTGRWWWDANYLAGSEKRLAELYEAKGDRAKAIHYYQMFVDLWQHADPELQPHVVEVKKRLARLAKSTG